MIRSQRWAIEMSKDLFLGERGDLRVETPTLHIKGQCSHPSSTSNASFLLMEALGGSRSWLNQLLESLHPTEETCIAFLLSNRGVT